MNRVAIRAGDAGALHGAALPVDEHAALMAALADRVAVLDWRGVGSLEDYARFAIAALHPAGDVRRARAVAGFAASLRHRRLRVAFHRHRRRLQERLDVIVLTVTAQAGLRIAFGVAALVADGLGLFDLGRFGGRGRNRRARSLGHDQIRFCGRDRLTVIEQRRIDPFIGDWFRRRLGGVGDGQIRFGGVRRPNELTQRGIIIRGGRRLSGRARLSGAAQRRMISVTERIGLFGRDQHRLCGVLRLNEITQHGIIIRGGRRLSGRPRLGETKQRRKNHARHEKRDRSLAQFVCKPCAPTHLPIGRRNRPRVERVSNFAAHAPAPP